MWTALHNPRGQSCSSPEDCFEFEWISDGSLYLPGTGFPVEIKADDAKKCLKFKEGGKLDAKECNEKHEYVCEVRCPSKEHRI